MKVLQKQIHWELERCEEFAGMSVTLSMGIAQFPTQGMSYEELFQTADKALYIAKAKGKDRESEQLCRLRIFRIDIIRLSCLSMY